MAYDQNVQYLSLAFWQIIMTAGPILAIALGIGLLIGLIQAATSIQEMTLSFVPKLFVVLGAMALFAPYTLNLFVDLSKSGPFATEAAVPLNIVLPAFITSELKTAFEIGFLIFLPFLVIDMVIASILMSLGMMMLSPMLISLPFKLLLFVLVDGWAMTIGSLSATFMV